MSIVECQPEAAFPTLKPHWQSLGCHRCCHHLSMTPAIFELQVQVCVVTPPLPWRETLNAPRSLSDSMRQVYACVGVNASDVSCLCCDALHSCRLRSCPLSQSIVDQSICTPSSNLFASKCTATITVLLNVLEDLPAPVHHLKNHCFALQPSVFHLLIYNHHCVSSLNEVFCVPVYLQSEQTFQQYLTPIKPSVVCTLAIPVTLLAVPWPSTLPSPSQCLPYAQLEWHRSASCALIVVSSTVTAHTSSSWGCGGFVTIICLVILISIVVRWSILWL